MALLFRGLAQQIHLAWDHSHSSRPRSEAGTGEPSFWDGYGGWATAFGLHYLSGYPYVGIVMIFILGAKGNEWAWANKKWGSVEDFKRTQRSWALWGLGIWIAVAAIVVLIIALAVLTSD